MNKKEKYGIGTIHENRHGEKFEIIFKFENYRIVRFIDQYKYITEVNVTHIKKFCQKSI